MSKIAASPPSPAPSPVPPSPKPKRIPRYLRRKNHALLGGLACLAKHGPEHYARMRALSAAARKGKRRPDRKLRVHLTLSREEWALVQVIGARAGLSQSAVVSRALAALVQLTSDEPPAKR